MKQDDNCGPCKCHTGSSGFTSVPSYICTYAGTCTATPSIVNVRRRIENGLNAL